MAEVTIYTKPGCPYCARALALLEQKGARIENVVASQDPDLRAQMQARSGRNTFPQIFIGERHIGGCDDLLALDRDGGLDPLLAG